MKLLVGKQNEDIFIEVDTMVTGEVIGNIIVLPGAKLELSATVKGDVILERHSIASIRGYIDGGIINKGGKLELFHEVRGEILMLESKE